MHQNNFFKTIHKVDGHPVLSCSLTGFQPLRFNFRHFVSRGPRKIVTFGFEIAHHLFLKNIVEMLEPNNLRFGPAL
jgi:hypothetical protein